MTRNRRFYIAVEVDFFDHPKTIEVGESLAFRHLRAVAWCHKHRTDGFLPLKSALEIVYSTVAAGKLEKSGLWEMCEGGWRIHDYLAHQPSREYVERISNERSKAGAKAHANRQQIADR